MKQIQTWVIRILLLAAVVFACYWWGVPLYKKYFTSKKASAFVPTTTVKSGKFTISFHEVGNLDAEKSVSVNSEIEGKILYLIPEGKTVKAGDKLVELDTTQLEKDVRNQELTYQNALADVNRAKAEMDILKESNKTEVEQAEAQLGFDQTEEDRAKNQLEKKKRLAADKLVPYSDVEQAEFDYRSKGLAVVKGTKSLALTKKEVQSKEAQKLADVRNVEFRANMEKFNLEEAKNKSKHAVITAPTSGLVVISKFWSADGRRKYKQGDSVYPQQTVCQLPDLSSMLVKVQVGESEAPRVKVNMPTLIRLEAVPNKLYHGTVTDISNLATEADPWDSGSTPGRKNFEVTVKVKEVDRKTIKPGMTADIEFICDQMNSAVYIPIEAIIEKDDKTYVYVKNGKRYDQVQVTVGKSNDNYVCITKGLKKGQVITLRDPNRSLDEQESGVNVKGSASNKNKKKAVPIPDGKRK